MEEKVALVTGSAKGIGAYLIKELANKNYNVVIHYNKSEKEAKLLKEKIINKYHVKCITIKADLRREKDIVKMIKKVIKEFNRLDLLINNAALSIDNTIEDKTKKEFLEVLEVNTIAPFLISKISLPYVKEIINISSLDSVNTFYELNIDYSASKAALNLLTKTFALTYPKIKCIAFLLPWVNTEAIKEMNPDFLEKELLRINQSKLIEPEIIAHQIIEKKDTANSGELINLGEFNDK
ncbi:MAG: SDR family NAD(P)-dependent oxidoreductase [Bacilli bacterium]|nr:SDR family NAD(P)-dependent oxidoreductase [Bacilli bacterium]